MALCKVCGRTDHVTDGGSVLCTHCIDNRFYVDDEKEVLYRTGVNNRIDMIKKLFDKDYNEVLHKNMVEQLIRCEIAMGEYEGLLAKNPETPKIAELLRSERVHWRKLSDQLNLTIRSMRGDTKNIKHDFPDDFKAYMKAMMESVDDDGSGDKADKGADK